MGAEAAFEQLLEQCLQELASTGDVEASLGRHPEHADRLRPLLEVALAARRHYQVVPAAPGRLVAGRERFLAAAAEQRQRPIPAVSGTRAPIRRLGLILRLNPIAVLLAVLLSAVILGSGAVWAARGSLPGELLYPVKLATEDVRLALASEPRDQVELALDFVERRAEEIQSLAAAGRQVPDQLVVRMEGHIEHALTRSAGAGDEELTSLLAQIAVRTRAQAQKLEQVHGQAPAQAAALCLGGAEVADAGLKDPQAFRRRYRQQEREPEPTLDPERERERRREQERDGTAESTPAGTPELTATRPTEPVGPKATPHSSTAIPGPKATPQGPKMTAVPSATSQSPAATAAPSFTPRGSLATATPKAVGATITPRGPKATDPPRLTPQDPGSTAGPQPTSSGPGPTHAPGPTPQGPGPTTGPQPTSQGPGPTQATQPTSPGPAPTNPPQPTSPGPGPGSPGGGG